MGQLAVFAMGPDRPGIVAALTGVLVAHGASIADSQMALLGGRSSIVLVVDPPHDVDLGLLEDDLGHIADDVGLDVVEVTRLGAPAAAPAGDPTHLLTVYGIDHPGIVHAVTTELARRRVSITDLSTRRVEDGGGEPLAAMMLEVAVPAGTRDDEVAAMLEGVARAQDLDVVVRPLDGLDGPSPDGG
ncbi:MAG TPA: ACT domain-containing protein [Baekduia sp.]|nr:ACT domain-containing protein [Baekduia sp.]